MEPGQPPGPPRDRAELAAVLASVPRVPLTVPLHLGIMASSSIAALFPPVQLGDEFYVDGGHRDQISTDAAVRLGATDIFAILASPSVMDAPTPDDPDPHPLEREVVVLVELPETHDRLDEFLYVGLTRATTQLVAIAPPGLAARLR